MESERAIRDGLALLSTSLRQDVDAMQRRAYVRALGHVAPDVIVAAVDRLIEQLAAEPRGRRYFPAVPDWLAACAEIVALRRTQAARQARALAASCPRCDEEQWETVVVDGVECVRRCTCFTQGLALMAAAGEQLLLPPGEES